ncbi:ribonuclease H-like domain-containing protein [Lenzites betulinus]|nr:ribonuclease H-like domain-containing protein [Lenzites betulinus]
MKILIPGYRGTLTRVRCFGHILNLVVKAILSQFGPRRKSKGEGSNDGNEDIDDASDADRETERQLRALDDGDIDEDEQLDNDVADEGRESADDAVLDQLDDEHPELVLSRADIRAGQVAVKKVRYLSKKVWNSPAVRSELAKLSAEANLNSEVLVRSVKTRWNTVTEVIKRALEMREVLGDLCDMAQFNKRDGVRLRRFLVTDEEWQLLAQLHEILEPFLVATKQISTSTRALVHEVIPYIDVLTEHLDNFANDEELEPSVRAAAKRGRTIMNKYYERTDETIVYRIAMSAYILCWTP